MTTPQHDKNDDLTAEDIWRITGYPSKKPERLTSNMIDKQKAILRAAGIYYWIKWDGTICTTWHHVHGANKDEVDDNLPNIMQVR